MKTTRKLPLGVALTVAALTPFAVHAHGTTNASASIDPAAAVQTERSARPVERGASSQPAAEHESYAYGWPLKPFRRQHPVRGFLGDPRISNHGETQQFHFGVDISAPNGTSVYATLSGTAYIHPVHDTTVQIVAEPGVEFSYWHIVPTIHSGQRVVAYETVIGHIEKPWAHVHFSEARDGVYLNPLRPGAMGPFVDTTTPFASRITAEVDGRTVTPSSQQAFDIVARVQDETPLAVPRPWHDLPVMPALVRWRLLDVTGRAVVGWRTAIDFRRTIPDASEYDATWALGATQNHVRAPGRYRIYLARSLSNLRSGRYTVEVSTRDTRHNASVTRATIVVRSS